MDDMNVDNKYDLCIVGAGMYGSAAARHASANPSLKVCLIGPNEPITEEDIKSREIHSSYYDEGRIAYTLDCRPPLQHLARQSIKRFREIESLSGVRFYNPVGMVYLAQRSKPTFLNMLQGLENGGTPFVDLSHHDDFRRRFPFINLKEDEHPIFDDNGAGLINPRKMVEAQKKVARLQGCEMIEEIVQKIDDSNSTHIEIVTEGGQIIKAKRVLICTGAFTKCKELSQAKKLKFIPNKETAVLLQLSESEACRISSMPPFYKYADNIAGMPPSTTGMYILPPILYPDGHYYLKSGPLGFQRNSELRSLRESIEWHSHHGDSEVIENFPKLLLEMLPGLIVDEVKTKTCITCDSPTLIPYIDRLTPTVSVAIVGNGNGATISEEVGRIAAHLSITGKWDSEVPQSLFRAIMEDNHDIQGNW